MKRGLHILAGLALWIGAIFGVWLVAAGPWRAEASLRQPSQDLWEYWTGERLEYQLQLPVARQIALGDPIFAVTKAGAMHQVGEIKSLGQGRPIGRLGTVTRATAVLYPGEPPQAGFELTYYAAPDSMSWIGATLLSPERKAAIALELSRAFEEHQDEMLATLRPVVEGSLQDALEIVGQELPAALERHRRELNALGTKYERDIVDRELVPLVRKEIWPIVLKHAEPEFNKVGQEVWQEVSLWRFGWRFAYDKSLLPDKKLVNQEWERFVEEEAMPILERHSDDFVAVVKAALKDIAANPEVQAALRRSLAKVSKDPELTELLWELSVEVIVENPRLHEALNRRWTSPEARRAISLATHRMEPAVRRVTEMIIGSREKGISPEFALVLRTQILAKDRRWFLLEPSGKPQGSVVGSGPGGAGPDSVAQSGPGGATPDSVRSTASVDDGNRIIRVKLGSVEALKENPFLPARSPGRTTSSHRQPGTSFNRDPTGSASGSVKRPGGERRLDALPAGSRLNEVPPPTARTTSSGKQPERLKQESPGQRPGNRATQSRTKP